MHIHTDIFGYKEMSAGIQVTVKRSRQTRERDRERERERERDNGRERRRKKNGMCVTHTSFSTRDIGQENN